MDKAHPITLFLIRHGFLIRGCALGLVFCVMLKTGFLDVGLASPEAPGTLLYLGIFLLASLTPGAGQFIFGPIWEKITPINDRITYVESEIVFVGSTLIVVPASLFFWGITNFLQGLTVTFWAILVTIPVFFLVWLIKSVLTPLHTIDTSEATAAAQTFREETPHFWTNALAYAVSGVVSALVLTLALNLLLLMRGGALSLGQGCLSLAVMILINVLAAPLYVWLGQKLRPRDAHPKGIHFTLGATIFLTVIVMLNMPAIFKNGFGLQAVLDNWHFAVAYGLIVLSYIGGGLAFSKIYKPKPAGFTFT